MLFDTLHNMAKTIPCEQCGEPFAKRRKKQRFCGKRCSALATARLPTHVPPWTRATPERREELRAARSAQMRAIRTTPKYQEAVNAYLASDRNPFKNVDRIKNPMTDFSHLIGGNGKVLPAAHQLLADRLGWPVEYPVGVSPIRPGYTRCYRIDVANPGLKIAVELDGSSHREPTQQARDAKKDTFLKEQGWTVFRFWNSAVMKDIEAVVATITQASSRPIISLEGD